MKQINVMVMVVLVVGALAIPTRADESALAAGRWNFRFDVGGTMPADPELTTFSGPITEGGEIKLSAGGQFDIAMGYRLTPWLSLEGELGFAANAVDSIGNWSYPDSSLTHFLFMANVVIEKPLGQFVPFAGVGVGGDFSTLSFGNRDYYDYYYSWDPDGSGTDCVLAYQAFGGVRYLFNENFSMGVVYRYFATGAQDWKVDWWTGSDFKVGADAIGVHSVCLVFSASF